MRTRLTRWHRRSASISPSEVCSSAVATVFVRLFFLPPYSPDLNPIELAFAKLKGSLRKAAERAVDTLWDRIGVILKDFTPQDCADYFRRDAFAAT